MELTYIVIAALVIALPFILTRLLSAKSRDTRTVLGAALTDDKRTANGPESHAVAAAIQVLAEERVKPHGPARPKAALPLDGAKDVVATDRKEINAVRLAPGLVETIRHAQDVSEEVQRLVKKGRRVEAIKLIREQSGMGLKEAKSLVDRLG